MNEDQPISAAEVAGVPQVSEILDMSLDLTREEKLRATALMMAVSYHKETIIKDGSMYQTMTAQGKNLRDSAPQQVVDAAIVFEGYLRGQYNDLVMGMLLGVQHAIDDFANLPDDGSFAPDTDATS